MEAGTNSSTGAVESLPEGAPSADPAADQITPPPEPEPSLATSDVAVAPPPPEAAVPTPQPLTMVSGVIEAPAPAPAPIPEPGLPLVTVIPAPEPPILEPPRGEAARATGTMPVANAAAPARPQPHAGDDPGFSDQIINWMKQGDRLSDPRSLEDLDLSDLAEPTDPVAHELLDSTKPRVPSIATSGRGGRWLSVGALGVAMSLGLYWAAQEPRSAAGFAAAPVPATAVVETAPAPPPPAPAPVAPPAPELAAVQLPQPAANPARGKHKHRRTAAVAANAGRAHRRHGR